MHKITVDRINKLVDVRLSGTLDVAGMEASGAATRAAVRSLGLGPGGHVSLYDISDAGMVGDAAIASALEQWADPRYSCVRGRKVALVVPCSTGSRSPRQARRATTWRCSPTAPMRCGGCLPS